MHQKPLLQETKDFLWLSERKQRGIEFHERYAISLYRIMAVFALGAALHWYIFDYRYALVFGAFVLLVGLSSELVMKRFYQFTGRDAVKYYALRVYDNGDDICLKQMHSWNKNPFDFSQEYHYQQLGRLAEDAFEKQNSGEYAQKNIPDTLRFIERQENDDYHLLIDMDKIEDYGLNKYYETLLQEVNYCYKFGAYTSTSMLLRKLTESLIEEILLKKGLYSELPKEPSFQDMVNIFVEKVLDEQFDSPLSQELQVSLDKWIRKKGNKGAHIPEELTREESQELMQHAKRTVRLLVVMRSDLGIENKDTLVTLDDEAKTQ